MDQNVHQGGQEALEGGLEKRCNTEPTFGSPLEASWTGAPELEEAVVQMCAWDPFAIYIYTSAAPCISMHVVILTLMLQQSQMQGVQRLHL